MIKKILPVISIILGCVLWGLAIVLTKKTINELIFPHLAMYRFIIASIVFIPFVKKKTLPSINKSDIKYERLNSDNYLKFLERARTVVQMLH